MADRAFLSIGEVLSLLREEFEDITISKIRFLESQGLLDPERTPSGYRKFYDQDVERLRWILRQQRENFLPLKVIRGRLTGDDEDGEGVAAEGSETDSEIAAAAPEPDAALVEPAKTGAGVRTGKTTTRVARPAPPPLAAATRSTGPSGVNLTIEELSSASGLGAEKLGELERYGFISGRPVGGSTYYDEDAMVVASLAAGFLRFGIEARHLRPYKNAAEREAGLFEQIVTPLIKQRNPEARRQALETLNELSSMGESLRSAMVRHALRGLTGG